MPPVHAWCYVGSGDSNSDPRTCMAVTFLLSHLSSQELFFVVVSLFILGILTPL